MAFRDIAAMLLIVLGAPWKMRKINVESTQSLGQLLDDLDSSRNDFGADAVAWNRGNAVGG